ncbi:MAG: response regulator [Deltaproteobacteria bacterium]|nr:response regulator [Deltaproteobacteria bacterium]
MAKILVVDDEQSICISLREFLQEANHEVSLANDANEAMDMLVKENFDVVLSDIILPRVTGVNLLEFIKESVPDVQVILMTGEPAVKTASEAVRMGAFDYLSKPISKEQLLKTVLNAANVKSLNDERRFLLEENKRHQENLERLVEKLRSLSAELSLVEERERRRMATTLHDSAAQNLAVAMMKLKAALSLTSDKEMSQLLNAAFLLVDTTANQLRNLSHELSPPALYEINLEAALEMLAEQSLEIRGLQCSFEDDGKPKPLSEDQRGLLYRCVTELLANAVKHSNAQSANIRANRRKNRIEIEVSDNGKGFDATGTRNGFGLFSIRERLHAIDGEFRIESGSERGTRVTLTVPLQLEDSSYAKE